MAEERTVGTLTTVQASQLLMLPAPSEISKLSRDGWMKAAGRDRWRLVDVVQGYVRYLRDRAGMIDSKALASVLGISLSWLAQLERDGVIKRAAKGAWPRDESIRAYVEFIRKDRQTKPTGATLVSMEAFARHIGLSREMVRRLIAEGVLTPAPDGRLDLDKSRIAYITHLRERPVRSQAQDKLRETKAKEIELRMAERCHSLIEREEAVDATRDILGVVLTGLGSLPARVAGKDLTLRRRIESEISAIRQTAAKRLKQQSESLRTTGEATTAPATFGQADGAQPVSAAPSAA